MAQSFTRQSSLSQATGTPLIGRTTECDAVERLLVADRARLISITGPGGVGKTRLALQVADQQSSRFRDGSVPVFLASLSDYRLVPLAIARSLDLRLSGDIPPERELARALAERELLLVIDTFEHLLPAARLFPGLLAASRDLRVIVTTRATLGMPQEVAFRVAPLSIPPVSERSIGADAVRWYDAVALFEDRARAASSGFALTDANASAVAEICRKLDGLPLAIELAAARIRALPPKLMVRHLEERREAPGSGARDGQARHRTMRDAISWSYELLSPLDQRLFRVLSVFRGSFTASDAIQLNALWEGAESDRALARARVVLLARASLLLSAPSSSNEPSYVMLRLLREFGFYGLVELGEEEAARRAHARWVADRIDAVSGAIESSRHSQEFARIEPLREEIRAAIDWSIAHSDRELAFTLLDSAGPYWIERGLYQELRRWLDQSLELWNGDTPPLSLLISLAQLTARQGDIPRSLEVAETAFQLAQRVNDQPALASAALSIAAAEGRSGSVERAHAMSELAMSTLQEIGDLRREAEAHAQLAHLAALRGDLTSSETAAESALAYWREAGEPNRAIDMLDLLSLVARLRGDSVRQSSLAHQTLEITRQIDNPFMVASGLWTAAAIACERKNFPESARFYGAEEAVRVSSGFALDPAYRDEHASSVATVRTALGTRAFTEHWEAGKALFPAEALAEAASFLGQLTTREFAAHQAEKQALQSLGLSNRQQDVLRLIGQGRSDREIAEILAISVRTVSKHVEAILLRMDARTRSGAAAIAARLSAESSTHARVDTPLQGVSGPAL